MEPCAGGDVGAVDSDIDEACEGIVWVFVSLIRTEIVFDIAWWGWRRVHTASEENGVNEISSYLDSRQSCVNFGLMDPVVIQYRTVRFGSPDDNS